MEQNSFHKSVLLAQTLDYLNIKAKKTYLDVTFGGGGHTTAILEKEKDCKVIALDWDKKTIEHKAPIFEKKFGNRLKIIWGNFANLDQILKKEKITNLDGILADFGTSQHQIRNTPGLSFQTNMPLDMRISPAHSRLKASDVLNKYSPKDLEIIFSEFGEERRSKTIALKIVEKRKKEKFKTVDQLTTLIESIIPNYKHPKKKYYIHPATRVFQALRIYINNELKNIKIFLPAAVKHLNKNGRIVCISFHSLEDRIVKNFFREQKKESVLKILTPKPIIASDEEIILNPSSRSAKLRAAEKI
ncbi:16S rRNA (cytosine(1402)-N(4))-methyltransferase RsmH [Candidatus Dependentiae bacterium]